jgi:hypothetical protein
MGCVYEACKKAEIDVVGAPNRFVGVSRYMLGVGFGAIRGTVSIKPFPGLCLPSFV